MEENRIPKKVLYMNSGTTRLRGRPINLQQDEVRNDGIIFRGEGWQEKAHNREEWKKLLRTARNHRILHVTMEWMNETSCPGHFPPGKEHGNPQSRRLYGHQTWSGWFGKKKNLVPTGIKIPDCLGHSLPTLHQLCYSGSHYNRWQSLHSYFK